MAAGLTPAALLQFDHITVGGDFTLRELTIHQHFGPERRDRASRDRRVMLEKVWAIWITGVLQPSLPQDILIDLGLTERPVMVEHTLDLYVQRPELTDRVQAPGTRLIDVFDRLDRALLILGAPGAGKTTLLLTLARDLLIRAAQDPEQPIPVVFPLSSWAEQRRPLIDWLVDALSEQYQIPRKTGRAWVEADQILPLLDGLDEVQAEHRTACVMAINTFRQDHGLLPLVVCSRVADYETLGTQLLLQGAIVVQPLTPPQVESYFTQVGQPLAAVRQALQEDPTLWELLGTPLMLYVVTVAYVGDSDEMLRTQGTPVEQQHLFATYVERMFQRRGAITRYSRQQTEHWLAWLAWQMAQHSQPVFYLERMQPDWLSYGHHWIPTQGTRLLVGLLGCLVGGLVGGLAMALGLGTVSGLSVKLEWWLGGGFLGGLIGGLIGGQAGYSKEITSIETVRWSWLGFFAELFAPSGRRLVRGWAIGLVGGLFIGILQGLGVMLVAEQSFGMTRWQGWWSYGLSTGLRAMLGIWFGVILVSGLGVILGGVLAAGLVQELGGWLLSGPDFGLGESLLRRLFMGLNLGLLLGLIYNLSAGFVVGLSGGEIATKTTPNEGIHRSAWMALISGLGSGLTGGLLGGLYFGLSAGLSSEYIDQLDEMASVFDVELGSELAIGLGYGLAFGLLVGLTTGLTTAVKYGGRACLQHVLLRLALRHHGSAPWRYVGFLDYAAERLFLRKVGGGYIFIHRLLQDHFAARHTEFDRVANQEASVGPWGRESGPES